MRHIEKTTLDNEIQDALDEALDNGWSWGEFGRRKGYAKRKLRCFLKREQYGLCAYSEVSFSDYEFHIEHVKPKGRRSFPELRFTYDNLVVSSPKHKTDVESDDLFGGHHKGEEYDEDLFIAPTRSDCGRFFQYSPSGSIAPSNSLSVEEKACADHTISCLGLESPLLTNLRKRIYRVVNGELAGILDEPIEVFEEVVDCYFETDDEGNLKPFQSLITQVVGR